MAEYKDIKGFKVQTVSTDPAASIIATGTWASGGNLNTARPGAQAVVESWNGTSWTEVGDLNTARFGLAAATCWIQAPSTNGIGSFWWLYY
jgi:hypothetical protein